MTGTACGTSVVPIPINQNIPGCSKMRFLPDAVAGRRQAVLLE